MTTTTSPTNTSTSPLSSLRALIPSRACTPAEALQVAERQAARLAQILGGSDNLHPGTFADLPRLRIVFEPMPVSGMSHWNGHEWVIAINTSDSPARQRFTLLHEYKHVIDHGATTRLYSSGEASPRNSHAPGDLAESAADYFAGCALVSKRDLKRAWTSGIQHPGALADHFSVSRAAIDVRLDQTGIAREVDPEPEEPRRRERCARPVSTPTWQPQRFRTVQPMYPARRMA